VFKQETVKTSMEQCDRRFVADAPVECGVRPTSAAQIGPSSGLRCDLPRNGELNHADVSLQINKNPASRFVHMQFIEGGRHLQNSVRKLCDQASCFSNYKVANSLSAGATHSVMNEHSSLSCLAEDERNSILLATCEYYFNTPILFKQYNPLTDTDYIQITGEDTGCWSHIGRIGGVSKRVKGVVKKCPALPNTPLGFRSFRPNTQIQNGLSRDS